MIKYYERREKTVHEVVEVTEDAGQVSFSSIGGFDNAVEAIHMVKHLNAVMKRQTETEQ